MKTIRRIIFSDETVKAITAKLDSLPKEIRDAMDALTTADGVLMREVEYQRILKERIDQHKAETRFMVSGQIIKKERRVYLTDKACQIELNHRTAKDPTWKKLASTLIQNDKSSDKLSADKLFVLTKEQESLKEQIKIYEQEILEKIRLETVTETKPCYSNDKARDDATTEALKQDEEYLDMIAQQTKGNMDIINFKIAISSAKNVVKFKENHFKSLCTQLNAVQGLAIESSVEVDLGDLTLTINRNKERNNEN